MIVEAVLYFHYYGNMETKEAVNTLAALAQETRLNIYRLLVVAGPEGITPGVISEKLGLAAATLSFHLKELNRVELISVRQEGRFLYYTANYAMMGELQDFLTENCCQGRPCAAPPKQVKKPSGSIRQTKRLSRK
jgi:ArsR family transcriptional regulator